MVVDFLTEIIKCERFYWKKDSSENVNNTNLKTKVIFLESDLYICWFIFCAPDKLIIEQWTNDLWIYFSRSVTFPEFIFRDTKTRPDRIKKCKQTWKALTFHQLNCSWYILHSFIQVLSTVAQICSWKYNFTARNFFLLPKSLFLLPESLFVSVGKSFNSAKNIFKSAENFFFLTIEIKQVANSPAIF